MTQFEPDVNDAPRDLLPIDEAASRFGTSRSTIYRLVRAGTLRTFRRRGDRRTFVSDDELGRALGFRPKE